MYFSLLDFKANAEKDHYKAEKFNADQRFEEVLNEFNEKIRKEKEIVLENVEHELKSLTEQVMMHSFFKLKRCYLKHSFYEIETESIN